MTRGIHSAHLSVRLLIGVLCLCLPLVTGRGQTNSKYDGTTPSALTPGNPAGSYALSGFDNINLYNGSLNFHLPLVQIGGRGAAGFTSFLTIEKHWNVKSQTVLQGCYALNGPCTYYTYYWPEDVDWNLKPGFSPGVLQGRQTGKKWYQPNSSCPDGWTKTLTRLTFTAGDGTQYELLDQNTHGAQLNSVGYIGSPNGGPSRGYVFTTSDGTSATFISDTEIKDSWGNCQVSPNTSQNILIYPTGYLMLRDGTRYRIINGGVAWIRDRNGNLVNTSAGAFTDPLNRQVTFTDVTTNPQIPTTRIRYLGTGGAARDILIISDGTINYLRPDYRPGGASYIAGGDMPSGGGYKTLAWLFPNLNAASQGISVGSKITSVILPDNRQYRFYYNPYGELARVELPTGGAFEYDWEGGTSYVNPDGRKTGDSISGIYRRVVERRVYADGINLTQKTRYIEETDANGSFTGIIRVDQMDATGTLLARSKHYYHGAAWLSLAQSGYDPNQFEDPKNGREYKTEEYAGNGTTLLRVTENTWAPRAAYPIETGSSNTHDVDLRVTETKHTLADTSQVARQTFTYSADEYNNQTDVYEYDYGAGAPGALVRRTHTDYLTAGYDTIAGGISNPDPAATIHLRSLPTQQIVYNASGTAVAKTSFEYDNYNQSGSDAFHFGLIDRGAITGLVSRSNQTPGGGGYSPTTDYLRGNVTKTTQYLLDSSGNVTGSYDGYAQYDIAGNVVKTLDPRSTATNLIATTIEYNDNFGTANGTVTNEGVSSPGSTWLNGQVTYAFPTTVTNPLNHTAVTQFDYYLGKPVDSQDANNVKASYYYDDDLDRPTQVRRNVTSSTAYYSQTTISYDDANRVITTTSDKDAASDNLLTGKAYYDGLGRTYRSAAYEGNTGSGNTWAITATEFDALGRAYRVTNPFRASTPDAALPTTPEWTTTTFDALGRALTVTTPDTAVVRTAYSGNRVMVGDQAGKKRLSETDALGQLVKVWEITSPATGEMQVTFTGSTSSDLNGTYQANQTSYLYDALGNLKTVTQGSQTRTFNYDSLKRLTSATNPESGTVSYTYDANGNLLTKTDARAITATYTYDALNRNTGVGYSSYNNASFGLTRDYDGATLGKGRLWKETAWNTESNGELIYHYNEIAGYDALGRPLTYGQWFLHRDQNNNYEWKQFNLARSYNRAGAVTSQTYPSGHQVSYSYDAAGRTSQMTGNLGGGSTLTYASNLTYTAAGQPQYEQYGTATPLYLKKFYNNRQQMVDLRLSSVSPFTGDPYSWDRGVLLYMYSVEASANGNPYYNSPTNNGNLIQQLYYVPKSGGGYVIPQNQIYQYDSLNRLTQVNDYQYDSAVGTWQYPAAQTFGYDRWGNRQITAASGTGINNLPVTIDAATNRLGVPSGQSGVLTYDAAGNQTRDSYSTGLGGSSHQDAGKREYDNENRVTAAHDGTTWQRYRYNASGQRTRRYVNGVEWWQVYGFDGELVAEYRRNSATDIPLQKEYGYRGGQMLVVFDSTETGDKQWQWLVQDHLSSTRMVVDRSGSLAGIRRHDYLPFGEEIPAGVGIRTASNGYVASQVRQKFAGYKRDIESGLDYAQARYYASTQGRFTSVDSGPFIPADPQNWNRYSYVQNNPLKFIDPNGQTLTLTGTDADALVEELEKKTGYKLTRDPSTGLVTIDKKAKRNKKGTSKDLAKLLKKVVNDKKTDVAIEVGQNQTGVFYDSFATRQLDIADHKTLDASNPEFAADSLGHVLTEYYTANKKYAGQPDSVAFPPSHDEALKFESKVLSNYTGKKEQKSQEAAPAHNTVRFIYTTVHYDIVLRSGVVGGAPDTVVSITRRNNTRPGVP